MMKKKDKDDKPELVITTITLVASVFLSVLGLLILEDKYLVLSFGIGVLASLIGLWSIVIRTDAILLEDSSNRMMKSIAGFIFNYLVYGIALFLSLHFAKLNVFSTLIGILMVKMVTYVRYGLLTGRKTETTAKSKEENP